MIKQNSKIYLITVICFLSFSVVRAQKKVELFCQLYVYNTDKEKQKIRVDYGQKYHFGNKDSATLAKLDLVKSFSNGIDALDYLKEDGWEIVSISVTNYNIWYTTIIYLKKEFER